MDPWVRLSLRWLAVVAVLSVVATWLAWPSFRERMQANGFVPALNQARKLAVAMDALGQDEGNGGYPADVGAASAEEMLARLVAGGYLTQEEADRVGIGTIFLLTNASAADPADTALLISRNFADPTVTEPGWLQEGVAVMTVGGKFGFLRKPEERARVALPPRQPEFLPDRSINE